MGRALQKATNGYNRDRELSIEQQSAIDLLVLGKSDQETADAVGVHRVTVTKWRLYDALFQAELNKRRRDVFGAAADRLRALLPVAVEVLEDELSDTENRNRGQLALAIIKAAGLSIGDIGSTDPDAIIERAALDCSNNQEAIKWGVVMPSDRQKVIDEWERRLSSD